VSVLLTQFALIIDSTKVVIAKPASPSGAGFAGDHPLSR
jgi:hypothetical protein